MRFLHPWSEIGRSSLSMTRGRNTGARAAWFLPGGGWRDSNKPFLRWKVGRGTRRARKIAEAFAAVQTGAPGIRFGPLEANNFNGGFGGPAFIERGTKTPLTPADRPLLNFCPAALCRFIPANSPRNYRQTGYIFSLENFYPG